MIANRIQRKVILLTAFEITTTGTIADPVVNVHVFCLPRLTAAIAACNGVNPAG